MKKVLNIFYGENIGGIEKNIEHLSVIFGKLNFEKYFLKISKKKINLKLEGKIFSLNENISNNMFLNTVKLFYRAYKISQICKKCNIDYSVSHGDTLNLSNILSKILFFNKSKIIITINNSLDIYKGFSGKIILLLIKVFYKRADKIVCISKELNNDIIRKKFLKKEKICVIYNPINIKEINKLKIEDIGNYKKIFNKKGTKFIHIARLDKIKNQKFLIDVFYEYINKYNKEAVLIIIGNGPEYNNLLKLINNLGLSQNVFLLGHQNNIYKFLNIADYFLFSSISEGFGRSLIEAGACGLPVITWDFKYGAKEYIRDNDNFRKVEDVEIHKKGVITKYNSKDDFIEGLKLLKNINFNKKEISEIVEKKFDIENISNYWSKLLNDL